MSGQLNNNMSALHFSKTPRDWDTALDYAERAMQRDPDYPYSYSQLGECYLSKGQIDRAILYFKKAADLTSGPTKVGLAQGILASLYVDIGDFDSAVNLIRRMRDLEPNYFEAINSEIHLHLARGDFSAVRGIVHGLLSENLAQDWKTSLMAAYETVIGDIDHAEDIYSYLETAAESPGINVGAGLYRYNELSWGNLGAVNLARLRSRNGDAVAAEELLSKAREFIGSDVTHIKMWFDGSALYVLAQISAIEGNDEVAMDNFRKAVASGWIRPWYGRIDPNMSNLREDPEFMQILEDLDAKLLEMRASPKVLASSAPAK